MAIRESIEAEIQKEKEFRENPDIVRKLLNISMELNFDTVEPLLLLLLLFV